MNRNILVTMCAAVAVTAIAKDVAAVCLDTAAATSPADTKMDLVNPCGSTAATNARINNVHIMQGDYDFTSADWSNRDGPNHNLCVTTSETAKHLNAFMLIGAGINFTRPPNPPSGFFTVPSFHSSWVGNDGDYLPLTSANKFHDWHDWLRHQVIDSLGAGVVAQFAPRSGIGIPNLLQGTCLWYDNGSTAFESLQIVSVRRIAFLT